MSEDYGEHEIITHIKSFAADPKDAKFEEIVGSFAGMADPFRSEMLNKLKGWTAADDGSTLRQRAGLWNLQRQLSNVHNKLRKAGR
jgi:hypothetical protein